MKSLRNWLFAGLLLLCLLLLPSPVLAHSQNDEAGATAQSKQSGPSCLQPPTYKQALKLSDAQLARYGLPSHFILAQEPATWQRNLTNAHRVCQQAGATSLNIHSALAGPAKTNFFITHFLLIMIVAATFCIAIGSVVIFPLSEVRDKRKARSPGLN